MKSSGTTTIMHSHLQRAKLTAEGLCAGWDEASLEECPILYEKSLGEYARIKSFASRVQEFRLLLAARTEASLALVGHSMLFRKLVPQMQERKHEVGNVSVWAADLWEDGTWHNVELLVPGWRDGWDAGPQRVEDDQDGI